MARWWWLVLWLPCCGALAASEILQDPTQPLQGSGAGQQARQLEALPRLQGLVLAPRQILLPAELVVRGSTRAAG